MKCVEFIDNTERKRTRGKAKDRVSLNKKLSKTEFSDYNFNRQEQEWILKGIHDSQKSDVRPFYGGVAHERERNEERTVDA